jgi:hypothetical protein
MRAHLRRAIAAHYLRFLCAMLAPHTREHAEATLR